MGIVLIVMLCLSMGFIGGYIYATTVGLSETKPATKFCRDCKHSKVGRDDTFICLLYKDKISGCPKACSLVRDFECIGKRYEEWPDDEGCA